ncbi:uncharacterized protein LOC128244448 [Mya arenaria]|uniref:uncharacterized protein LOC128244448 n=1 Tax=Mya arenaria TaxID=6604 RepID=UPI0022E5B98B|nr:uncharacterized protein LOC128244448 [Mya arenaria]
MLSDAVPSSVKLQKTDEEYVEIPAPALVHTLDVGSPCLLREGPQSWQPQSAENLQSEENSYAICSQPEVSTDFPDDQLEKYISRKFPLILEEADATGIADILYSNGVIQTKDVEAISEEKFRRDKVDTLLKAISRSPRIKDKSTIRIVQEAFAAAKCAHLVEDITKPIEELNLHWPEGEKLSKNKIRTCLHQLGRQMEKNLDVKVILDDLVGFGVLSIKEHQNIKEISFYPTKVKYILKYILRKDEEVFMLFYHVIEKHCKPLASRMRQAMKEAYENFDLGKNPCIV